MSDRRQPDEDRTGDLAGLPLIACPPELGRRLLAIPDRHPRRRRWWVWVAPLATAAALAVVLLATRPAPAPRYTEVELATARAQALASLSTVMTVIERTQREAMTEVLGRQVPQTLGAPLRRALQSSEGGQG